MFDLDWNVKLSCFKWLYEGDERDYFKYYLGFENKNHLNTINWN